MTAENDLVARLHAVNPTKYIKKLVIEAADEIERLRRLNDGLNARLDELLKLEGERFVKRATDGDLLKLARFQILDGRNCNEEAKEHLLGLMADEIERLEFIQREFHNLDDVAEIRRLREVLIRLRDEPAEDEAWDMDDVHTLVLQALAGGRAHDSGTALDVSGEQM